MFHAVKTTISREKRALSSGKTLLSFLFFVVFAQAAAASDLLWTKKADMPTGRTDFAQAVVNGKIYVMGGYNGNGQVVAATEEFDPATNSWTKKADMPTGREQLSACVVNNKIYAIGGDDGCYYVGTVEEYDPATNSWTTKTDMPTAREYLGTCVVNDKIYAIGGYDGVSCKQSVEEYNPATNSWTVKANMPTAREEMGVSVIGGKIYAVGGDNVATYLKTVEAYDPASNTWASKSDMSIARYAFATAALNGRIYVLGGYGAMPLSGSSVYTETELSSVQEYNPESNTWATKSDMPTSRYYLGAEVLNGKIYAVNGYHISDAVSSAEEFDPAANKWAIKSGTTVKRLCVNTAVVNNKLYVLGGYNQDYQSVVEEAVYSETLPSPKGLAAVDDLTAVPVYGTKIYLTWTKSASKDISYYNIYYGNSPSSIDFSQPMDSVDAPAVSWLSYDSELESGKTYYFAVRAVNSSEEEDKNTNIVSATTADDLSKIVQAVIKAPQNGKKVTGTRLTVMAETVSSKAGSIKTILFQYKKTEETEWTSIPAADDHANPDSQQPFFMHWDVTGLAEGSYNIRAVASGANNTTDNTPGYVTIEINHTDPDIIEIKTEKGEQSKQEKIDNGKVNTIKTAGEKNIGLTQIKLPSGSINPEFTSLTLVVDPADKVAPPEGVKETGEYRKIELLGATLQGQAAITIPYQDENFDDKVDGTNIPVASLCVYAFNEKTSAWEKLPSTIDYSNKTVTGTTTHFSLFALFGAPPDNFNDVRAFPNPFMPSKGHTFVKFDNLTLDSKLQIFTISGELVFEKDNINAGEFEWNAVNQSGNAVVSGVYVVLLTNDAGVKKVLKIAVIK